MTTLPPGPPAPAPHEQRQVAEGFGADAARYDRARPGYPAGLLDRIVAASPGRDVLDAGSGTGISSRLLAAAGCRVLGVDPDPRMAAAARAAGTAAEVAAFEDWDAAGRRFDLVTAAQAWHWVDPAAGAAKAAAVLRPGGRLAVLWNVFEPPAPLRAAFGAVYRRVLPDSPATGLWDQPALDGYRRMMGGRAAAGIRQAGAFGEPEEWLSSWQRPSPPRWLPERPSPAEQDQPGWVVSVSSPPSRGSAVTFTPEEAAYIRSQPLARVATAGPDGQPDVVPVGFEFDGTSFYIGGFDPAKARRTKNIQAGNDKVALVIDDLAAVDPWSPRFLRVYGTAELVQRDSPSGPQPVMKVTPDVSWSWNLSGQPLSGGRSGPRRTVHRP